MQLRSLRVRKGMTDESSVKRTEEALAEAKRAGGQQGRPPAPLCREEERDFRHDHVMSSSWVPAGVFAAMEPVRHAASPVLVIGEAAHRGPPVSHRGGRRRLRELRLLQRRLRMGADRHRTGS